MSEWWIVARLQYFHCLFCTHFQVQNLKNNSNNFNKNSKIKKNNNDGRDSEGCDEESSIDSLAGNEATVMHQSLACSLNCLCEVAVLMR